MSYKGKIPFAYDKNSSRYKLGAFKNWPRNDPSCSESRRLAEQDRTSLEMQREARG